MNTTTALSITKPFSTPTSAHIPPSAQHRRLRPPALPTIKSSNNDNNNTTTTTTDDTGGSGSLQPVTPPDTVEIRFRRGSRRRKSRQQNDGVSDGLSKKAEPKDWESMTVTEKAVELYVGEKGLLFWLNKFAYASIFIIIGAWILFRFVGPALNLYQLDSPPLSPTSILKGS